jgi:hypothetical protein
MGSETETQGKEPRKPWSTPRVILTELRSTNHDVGKTPADKTNFAADSVTPSGSLGS